jgi:bidirectional [NiFe] hydrogenase diaphorase subunit
MNSAAVAAPPTGDDDALIEVLHEVQLRHGYLPRPVLRQVACSLQLPLSRVFGVASFYHLFQLEAPSAHRCTVCLGTACFVRGGPELAAVLAHRLGARLDGPASAAGWSLQSVSCLGACGQAPVLVVDGALLTRLPLEDAAALAGRLAAMGVPEAVRLPEAVVSDVAWALPPGAAHG